MHDPREPRDAHDQRRPTEAGSDDPGLLLDPDCFTFTKAIEDGYETFLAELNQLDSDEFLRWPHEDAFDGEWLVYPLVEHCRPEGFEVDMERHARRCPHSVEFLSRIPRLRGAAFSRLTPGSRIHPHCDHEVKGVIRAHLGLHIPDGSNLYFDETHHRWAEGKLLLFNGQERHSVVNESPVPRDILMVDIELVLREAAVAGVEWVPWCPER